MFLANRVGIWVRSVSQLSTSVANVFHDVSGIRYFHVWGLWSLLREGRLPILLQPRVQGIWKCVACYLCTGSGHKLSHNLRVAGRVAGCTANISFDLWFCRIMCNETGMIFHGLQCRQKGIIAPNPQFQFGVGSYIVGHRGVYRIFRSIEPRSRYDFGSLDENYTGIVIFYQRKNTLNYKKKT